MKLIALPLILLLICSGTASAAWLPDYDHRIAITVNNGGASTLNYYQFNFTNATNTLVAAGHMQASGADCRITDASNNLIPFWNETAFNATDTKIWANGTLTVGDNIFYMYYGNSGASDVSDGDTTFDDFIDNDGSSYSFVKNSSNPIIPLGGAGAWDEKTIYSMALPQYINSTIKMVGGKYYVFYTGAGNTAHPNHEVSVGLATGTVHDDLTKHPSNPIINRSDIGLGGAGQGVAAFDIKDIDGTTYMFTMCMYSNTDFRITMFEADDSTLLNWSNMTDVLTTNYKDHCPWVIEDPNDANKLIMYYGYAATSGSNYQIGRATANKADPWTWTYDTTNNPILAVSGKNVLYPFVKYENSAYYLHYIKNPTSSTYKIYTTSSASDSGFSDTSNITIDLGSSGAWDDGYVSTPREYTASGDVWMYFTGRKAGSNYYTGMGVADWEVSSSGSLGEWDVTGGSVSATTDHPHAGSYGIKYETTGASPYPEVQKNCVGKNKIYETWIYDDMSTTANFMNTVRFYDTSGADPLVGIWMATSSTHYAYRAEGGSYTASSVSRSNGWHKIQFDVAASDTKVYIDGTLIFTETGLDEDNLDFFRVMGYTGGTGYSDTYIVRQYTATEPTSALGAEEDAPAGNNDITLYANEYALINNWTTDQTYQQVDNNISNTVCFSYYNSTSGLWEAYRSGYTYGATYIIPKNCSAFVFVNAETTISATPHTTGSMISGLSWFYGFINGSTTKNLTVIKDGMVSEGLDVWMLYAFSNATQAYTATGSYDVAPNEGYIVYSNNSMQYPNHCDQYVNMPSNLAIANQGATYANLTWNAASGGTIAGYEIFRDSASLLDAGNILNYNDTGLTPGQAYIYKVRAYDASPCYSPFTTKVTKS